FFRLLFCERRQEPTLHLPEIGGIVGKAVRVRLKVRPGCDDMHILGSDALCLVQQLTIEAKLKNGSGLRFTSELGVNGLIRPFAKRAREFDATQDIGSAAPTLVRKCRLGDDWHALFHGGKGFRNSALGYVKAIDPDNI